MTLFTNCRDIRKVLVYFLTPSPDIQGDTEKNTATRKWRQTSRKMNEYFNIKFFLFRSFNIVYISSQVGRSLLRLLNVCRTDEVEVEE